MAAKKNLPDIVDRLGRLLARRAELDREAERLKDDLRAAGVGAYEGALFRATVSTQEREVFDGAAAKAKLLAEGYHAFVRAHTRTATSTPVRVVAKTGRLLDEAA